MSRRLRQDLPRPQVRIFVDGNAASIVEELETLTVMGGVRVHDGSGGGKQFEERAKGMHLIRDFQLSLRACGEPRELVHKEGAASAPPETAILLMCARCQPK